MPDVTSRWHLLLSKKFLLARYSKLAAVHGTFDRSSGTLMSPRLVEIVMTRLPTFGTLVGGMPTSLIDGFCPLLASGFHTQGVSPGFVAAVWVPLSLPPRLPASQAAPATTRSSARPEPTMVSVCRRLRACAARSAISRSSRARAAARCCRSLIDDTVFLPGGVSIGVRTRWTRRGP